MFLVFLRANNAWVYLWASKPLALDGEPMFYTVGDGPDPDAGKAEALERAKAAALRHGLRVGKAIGPGFRVEADRPTVGSVAA